MDSQLTFLPVGYTRSFTTLSDAAKEAGMSRIRGRIHWMSDNSDGATLRAAIATHITDNFPLPLQELTGALLIYSAGLLFLLRLRSRLR